MYKGQDSTKYFKTLGEQTDFSNQEEYFKSTWPCVVFNLSFQSFQIYLSH